MWNGVVWIFSFALVAVGQDSETQTLDDYDTNSFPYKEPPSDMKKISGRSIFITPTIVRCPVRYQYHPLYDRCVKRIRLVRTEEQLLQQLNSMYGSRQKDKIPPESFSGQKLNMKDRLSTKSQNSTITHPGLRIRHSEHRRANKISK